MLNDPKDWQEQIEKKNLDIIAEEDAELPEDDEFRPEFDCPDFYNVNGCCGCPFRKVCR